MRGQRDSGESEDAGVQLRVADESILACLDESRAEYPAIVANRTGLHVPYVRRRCDWLAGEGLLERVSDEVVYRITDDGREAVTRRNPRR